MKINTFKSSLLLLVGSLIWGTTFVAQSMGTNHLNAFAFNCIRNFIGVFALIPVLLWQIHTTNTENTTKNTSYTTPSIYHENIDREIDGVKDIVEEELDVNEAIPLEYYDCPPKMDAAIRILTDYDIRSTASDDFDRETYKLFSDCLGEMCTEKYPRAYHGRKVESGVKFIEKINYCLLQEGDLYTFVEWALNDFKEAAKRKEIKNTRAYMKSVICTALFDFKIKNEALLSRLS
jgi:hypothetical protein